MALVRRTHEWAADHFRWIQYPQSRARRIIERSDWTTTALKWMALGFGLSWIWGGFLLVAICVIVALAS